MKFELYNLATRKGKHIRVATKVTLTSGRVIEFMERLSNEEAGRQALRWIEHKEQKTPQEKSCRGNVK